MHREKYIPLIEIENLIQVNWIEGLISAFWIRSTLSPFSQMFTALTLPINQSVSIGFKLKQKSQTVQFRVNLLFDESWYVT